ncbi:AsnC family transcriptional regulator [Croceicoccus estronivorus]|uniref:Lrp/AsnC family transcriptional regulator n=1 Tax=Croceicoccus estronivorus TaxID=1172626 RepID=UPI0008316E6E|nr:Lrp/AsnC family transcriptional regulator [Croceicoccus estronivorus]OCC24815.1 AsnC family transcriptional regulator [Croceicoccus estronivorus]
MAGPSIDDLDRQLIGVLAEDARVSNRRVASDLGVTEGTVRCRIKRLQQENLISFTAITGLELASKSRLGKIRIQTEAVHQRQLAETISRMDPINAVMLTLGSFNILAMCLFDDLEELAALASERILALPGVQHVETSVAVRQVKYNALISKIT